MIVLGLTGSIGMGKSTTAKMFADAGVPVHDSDAVVHQLYASRAAPLIEQTFPGTVCNGIVDRDRLSKAVLDNPEALRRLETIVHPLVSEERERFLRKQQAAGKNLVLLDIPLLFEVGAEKLVDKIVVVTADAEIQRARVLDRPGMSEDKFRSILARQVPDAEKRAKADFLIDTGKGMDAARGDVRRIITELSGEESASKPSGH